MFGNGFDRKAIINARMLWALWNGKDHPKLSDAAREISDVPTHRFYLGRRRGGGPFTELCETLDSLEFEDVVCFFLVAANRGAKAPLGGVGEAVIPREAIDLADDYAKTHDPAGVEIRASNEGHDDPFDITFDIGPWRGANRWADNHGSLAGGTWECADGEDFVYDLGMWREGLDKELQDQGYDINWSDFNEPDEDDLRIAQHVADCDECDDFSAAKEHLESVTSHVESLAKGHAV